MDVGIRELRDELSKHLAAVRAGHTVTVTDHGTPVARLVPVGRWTALQELMATGRVTPAAATKRPSPEPVEAMGTVSDLMTHPHR